MTAKNLAAPACNQQCPPIIGTQKDDIILLVLAMPTYTVLAGMISYNADLALARHSLGQVIIYS